MTSYLKMTSMFCLLSILGNNEAAAQSCKQCGFGYTYPSCSQLIAMLLVASIHACESSKAPKADTLQRLHPLNYIYIVHVRSVQRQRSL